MVKVRKLGAINLYAPASLLNQQAKRFDVYT